LTTLATLAPAQAQDVRFRDAAGRVTGSTRTDSNGVTTFHDASGRVTGMDVDDGKSCACALRQRLAVCEQISDARPRRNSNAPHLRRFSWQES